MFHKFVEVETQSDSQSIFTFSNANTAFSLTLSRRNSKAHCLFYTALRCPADRSTPSLPLAWSSRFEQYGYTSFKLQEVILLPAHQGDATYSAEMADFEI